MDISTATIDRGGYNRKDYKYPGNAGDSASFLIKTVYGVTIGGTRFADHVTPSIC
jgi:hypothetical protein